MYCAMEPPIVLKILRSYNRKLDLRVSTTSSIGGASIVFSPYAHWANGLVSKIWKILLSFINQIK